MAEEKSQMQRAVELLQKMCPKDWTIAKAQIINDDMSEENKHLRQENAELKSNLPKEEPEAQTE